MTRARRYETEFILNLVTVAKYQGRQKDLKGIALPSEPACNLYIVSKAPRVTVDPASVQFTASGELFVTLKEQIKDKFREHPVHIKRFAPDAAQFTWHSEWPYDEFTIVDPSGRQGGGPVSTFFRTANVMPEPLLHQEILYIGQAFGKAGERTAFDRLQSHSTLQRIYSETQPDMEIWLTLCSIDDIALSAVIGKPGGIIEKTESENEEHMDRVYDRYNSADFWYREAVTGAEAGLISYFKPQYNIVYKDNYPDPAHIHISTLYELEFHTLVAELQSFQAKTKFWTKSARPDSVHFAHYTLGELADPFNLG
jgi:hypothetical protein